MHHLLTFWTGYPSYRWNLPCIQTQAFPFSVPKTSWPAWPCTEMQHNTTQHNKRAIICASLTCYYNGSKLAGAIPVLCGKLGISAYLKTWRSLSISARPPKPEPQTMPTVGREDVLDISQSADAWNSSSLLGTKKNKTILCPYCWGFLCRTVWIRTLKYFYYSVVTTIHTWSAPVFFFMVASSISCAVVIYGFYCFMASASTSDSPNIN